MAAVTKVRGATIVETLVALLIIMAVLSISLTIFVQVSTADISLKQEKARGVITESLLKTKREQKIYTEDEQVGDLRLHKEITTMNVTGILLVQFLVYDPANKLLLTERHLIETPKND